LKRKITGIFEGKLHMKPTIYMVTIAVVLTLAIGGLASAHGPGGVSWVSGMMGSGGYATTGGHGGMMGGQGSGMMGSGQGSSNLREELVRKLEELNQKRYQETETFRKQIREKRGVLASLFRSDNPDKNLIDQKIDELNRLESDLDQKIASYDMEMRRILNSEPRGQARNRGWNGMYYGR
jgi:Spy/CpxP family protein refolding chaperone